MGDCHGCPAATHAAAASSTRARQHIVAIVGPPNSGKSTLFNRLTGLRQKVANFPGVTVEHRMGRVKLEPDREVFVVDLPGVYSLTPRTEDERVTHDVLTGEMKDMPRPEAVLLILDSTNLSRHLVLAAPVLEPRPAHAGDPEHGRRSGAAAAGGSIRRSSRCSWARRWRWSARRRATGVDKVFQFLAGATPGAALQSAADGTAGDPGHPEVPRLGRQRRQQGQYHAPAPPLWTRRLDAIFLHPVPARWCFCWW